MQCEENVIHNLIVLYFIFKNFYMHGCFTFQDKKSKKTT